MKIQLILIVFILSITTLAAEKVVILGDSLTEGYGVDREEAFPAVLQKIVGEKFKIVAAGVGGSTSASAPKRALWVLKQKPEIILLALGGNDGLRGLSPEQTYKNLAKTIELIQKKKVKVILCGMKAPPNYGPDFTKSFSDIFSNLAKKYKVTLIPFLLEGVAGDPKLNIDDGIHPNAKGHQVIAKIVGKFLMKEKK